MLDNIVTENCMAAVPIEILADVRHSTKNKKHSEDKIQITTRTTYNIDQCAASAPPVTKTNKTKTILNWLKNTTANNNNNTLNAINKTISDNRELNSCKHYRSDKTLTQQQQPQIHVYDNCTCPGAKHLNNTSSHKELTSLTNKAVASKDDDTLREFRGVQTLKHFWNKRITANRESALRARDSKKQFTKSVSCLVNAINNTREPPLPLCSSSSPPPLNEFELLKARKLRALSLHDCSRYSPDFDEISLSDIDVQKHLEKDNFYKYKTAEQASKLRELSEQHCSHRKLSNGIILSVGQKAERFDWLKRHDKFSRKKSLELTFSPTRAEISKVKNKSDNSNQFIACTSATNNNDLIINNKHAMHTQKLKQDTAFLPTTIGQINTAEVGNTNHSSETSTPTLTAANSPQHAVSRCKATARKDSAKPFNSASSISRDSSTTSLATSTNSHKTVVKRNSSARKYSFKTHTRSYHVPRKMHANKEAVNGATAVVSNPSNSLVAKLTQQFNEIIQQDKTLLAEIKRKNGVLMTHKGHVYKLVDTGSLNRNQTATLNRNDSKGKEVNGAKATHCPNGSSTVQKNIKKFESESRGLKPKVPLKSLQVLRKSNELVTNKTIAGARFNTNRLNNNKKDTQSKAEIKPQTLPLPTTLEMVQEEAKTPVENKDTKVTETSKESELPPTSSSMENICEQDEFLAVLPPKIDSVIYKTIHRSKQKKADAPQKEEETAESVKEGKNASNDESKPKEQPEDEHETPVGEHQKQNEDEETNENVCSKEENKPMPIYEEFSNNEPSRESLEIITKNDSDKLQQQTLIIESAPCSFEETKWDTKTIDHAAENSTTPEPFEEEDKKKRKHKYAKIYEKLRFFTPFAHSNKKQKFNATSPNSADTNKPEIIETLHPNNDLGKSEEETPCHLWENPTTLKNGEYTPMSSPTPKQELQLSDDVYSVMYNPDAKLLDALEQVDKRLQNLSNDNNKILESDDYGHPLTPNSSFLHQTTKDITPKPSTVIQAVNVTLVNAIEGEQMIMEQKEIQKEEQENKEQPEKLEPQHEHKANGKPLPALPPKKSEIKEDEEPFYEPICVDKTTTEIKTESPYNQLELIKSDDLTTSPEKSQTIEQEEEDIYQTVDEAKMNEYNHSNATKTPEIIKNSLQDLDGYEPIENPDLIITNTSTNPVLFDGYEEYTPAVDVIITTTVVRKVTDQLPDLPKPKRNLPKSPTPCRTAPKPPRNITPQIAAEESLTATCHEPPYYGDEENIYDTIKSSHCYESLQSVGNKLQDSPPLLRTKNSDSVSLSSNCYESISQYKRINIVGHHSGGSSNGSTLTISSENKTNSLYEDSFTSSLHYSSKRIYRLNTHTHNKINKCSTDVISVNGYVGSIGRLTDTSDEWTDVTDNEDGDTESKPQFIIVRERSKAHKSPDWSRRVRDKRQRKSKSCIEDGEYFYQFK